MTPDLRRLAISLSIWGLGEGLFTYVQALYIRDLGASPAQIGAVLGMAGVAMVFLHIPAGYLADRFGRKPVMVTGWLLGLSATLVMYFGRSLPVFAIGLALYYSTAFVNPAFNSYTTASRGTLTVERAITAVAAAYGTGSVVSPALGGWIASVTGLRSVYGWACVLFVISTLVLLPARPQAPAPKVENLRYRQLFANRQYRGLVALVFAGVFAMYVGIPLAPNYLQQVRSVSVGMVGLLGSVNALGLVLFNMLLGYRHPRGGWIAAQLLVLASTLLLWRGAALPWFLLGYFLRGGFGAARALATSQVGRVVQSHEIGLAFGVSETASAMAVVFAPLLAGGLYERGPALPFVGSALLIAVALLLTLRLAPRSDRLTQPAESGPHLVEPLSR